MLGRVGSSVGRLGIISANRGPNFSYTGTNAAFQSALTEAAYTGLVAGFSAPAYPQYWLRGVSYPSFLSVPGATYTRTGSRAGLDAAVVYSANVPRIAPVNGLRVHGAGTNLIRSSENLADTGNWTFGSAGSASLPTVLANTEISPTGSLTADTLTFTLTGSTLGDQSMCYGSGSAIVTGQTYTASMWVKAATAGDIGKTLGLRTVAAGGYLAFTLTAGWQRISRTEVAISSTLVFEFGMRGTLTPASTVGVNVWGAQLEQSSFATDYIPNANTGASSSAGADDVQVAASALPAASSIVFLIDMPAQAFTGPANIRAFEWNNVIGAAFETNAIVTAVPVGATLPSVTGLSNAGARRIAILHTVGAPTKMSVNGSATVTGTNVGGAIPSTALYLGNRSALDRALSGGITAFAAYPGSPSDAQLQAMSAL